MELNGRMMYIMQDLAESENGELSVGQLCETHGIKKRTFYYDIKKINSLLEENGIERIILDNGICIASNSCKKGISRIISDNSIRYYNSAEERKTIISVIVGLSGEKITASYFCDLFDISKNTLLSDLRIIKKELVERRVVLDYDRYGGYVFSGSEVTIRSFIISEFRKIKSHKTKDQIISLVNKYFADKLGERDYWLILKECLVIYEELQGTDIVDVDIESCVFTLAVSFARSLYGHKYNVQNKDRMIRDTRAFESAKVMMRRIEECLGLKAYNAEIYYVVPRLLSRQIFRHMESGEEDPAIAEFTDSFMRNAEYIGNKSFRNRDSIRKKLIHHVGPMMYRLAYGISLENPIAVSIRSNYGDSLEIARKAVMVTDPKIGKAISEDELCYLAIYIASGTVQLKSKNSKHRVLIICAEGVAAALMIQIQLEELLGECYLFEISSIKRVMDIKLENYLLVVTTLDNEYLENKAIRVKLLLSDDDKKRVFNALNQKTIMTCVSPNDLLEIIQKHYGSGIVSEMELNKELLNLLVTHSVED